MTDPQAYLEAVQAAAELPGPVIAEVRCMQCNGRPIATVRRTAAGLLYEGVLDTDGLDAADHAKQRQLTGKRATPIRPTSRVAAYLAGDPIDTIAARHGVSYGVARRALLEACVELRRRGPQGVPDHLVPQVRAEYLAGMTADGVGAKHGFDRWAIVSALHRRGVALRRAGGRSKVDGNEKEVAAAYAAGAILRELADLHSASDERLRRAIIKRGVKLRPRGGPSRGLKVNGDRGRSLQSQ